MYSFTRMHAVPAADGFAPTARSWYPTEVFHKNMYIRTASSDQDEKCCRKLCLGDQSPQPYALREHFCLCSGAVRLDRSVYPAMR